MPLHVATRSNRSLGSRTSDLLGGQIAPWSELPAEEADYDRYGPQWWVLGEREYANVAYRASSGDEPFDDLRAAQITTARKTALTLSGTETRAGRDNGGVVGDRRAGLPRHRVACRRRRGRGDLRVLPAAPVQHELAGGLRGGIRYLRRRLLHSVRDPSCRCRSTVAADPRRRARSGRRAARGRWAVDSPACVGSLSPVRKPRQRMERSSSQ